MLLAFLSYVLTKEAILKIIDYRFFITESSFKDFSSKYMPIDDAINEVTVALENSINNVMEKSDPPMKIKWNKIPQAELGENVDLGKCGLSMNELVLILHRNFDLDSQTSSIAMYECDSKAYEDLFSSVDQLSPYITHTISTFCSTRTLIFFETESEKFKSMYATALLKAAGIREPNPLKLEEVTNGDKGLTLIFTVDDEAMKQLHETTCFRS